MNELIVFQGSNIRRTLFNNEWYFSVEDIVQALTDSVNPKEYIKKCVNVMSYLIPTGRQFVPMFK